jgi:hypothetical protein
LIASGRVTAIALRLCVAASVLGTLAYLYGPRGVEALLPLFRAEIKAFDSVFQDHTMRVTHQGADRVVRLDVKPQSLIVIGGRVVWPSARATANATTLVGHVYQPLVIAFTLALAWPAAGWRERAARGVLAVVLAFLVIAVDVPVVLYAELWEGLRDALAPGEFSLAIVWKDFLQGGGRLGLGLTAGAMAVLGARRIARR